MEEAPELGEYSVLVGAFEYPWVVGFRTEIVRLHGHDAHTDTDTNWGVAAWIAAALSVLMAVLFGLWATREETGQPPDVLLPVGFGIGVAPLVIAALALAHKRPRFATDALILSVAMLVPHCICDNFANHGWIEWIGASPMCFFLFYSAALLVLIGQRGVFARTTLVVGTVALVVTGGLAVSHHMFHFPW